MTTGFTLAGVNMRREGFCELTDQSIARLIGNAPPMRGENREVDDLEGSIAYPGVIRQAILDLEALVSGEVDQAGAAHPSILRGKTLNLRYLRDTLGRATGLLAAVLTMDDGTVEQGNVQVRNWTVNRDEGALAVITFDLIIPAGYLS